MRKIVITPETEKYILENYLQYPSRTIAINLKVSKTFILRFLNSKGLKVPLELTRKWQVSNQKKPFTAKEHS